MAPVLPYFEQPILRVPLPFTLPIFGGVEEIPIHGFGVLVAIGFLVGARVAMTRAARLGLDPEMINRLVGWLVVGTFIGGHVGYGLMYEPESYLAQPIQFLYVWQGLSSFGGIVTCLVLCVIFFRRYNLPFWPYIDCLAHGFAIGWFFGRMGCFVAADHPGVPTSFFLAQYGICDRASPDLACHNLGLYEALFSLAVFGLFRALDRRPRIPGFYALLYGLLYGPTRFGLDFLRLETNDPRYYGFTPAQYWSVLVVVLCGILLVQRFRSGAVPVWAPPGTTPDKRAEPAG